MISQWVPISFALVGMVAGFFAGLSLTPTVGVLLPLLFGLIGGGSGFFVATNPGYSKTVGTSVSLFAFFCLVGAVAGIHLREGVPWSCFISACKSNSSLDDFAVPASVTDQDKLMELISIKTVLQRVDLSNSDKARIFQIALADSHANDKSARPEDFGATSLSDLDQTLQGIADEQLKLEYPLGLKEENPRPALKK